jgi:hypothetical protein
VLLVVKFIEFLYLVIWIHDPACGVCALLGSEGSNIPFLNLTRGDVVWSPPAIVTLIVGVQIVAVRSFLSTVLHSRDYVELLTDRRVCDWLGRS